MSSRIEFHHHVSRESQLISLVEKFGGKLETLYPEVKDDIVNAIQLLLDQIYFLMKWNTGDCQGKEISERDIEKYALKYILNIEKVTKSAADLRRNPWRYN